MTVTQRGKLTPDDERRLLDAHNAAKAAADHRRTVAVEMMHKSSVREVARLTGLSTNTLQRWKREAPDVT